VNIHLSHEIALSEEDFWKEYFDKEEVRRLYLEGLRFPEFEMVEYVETETTIRRKMRALPKLDMPGPVAKLLGSSFRYTEDGTFDRASKTYKWKTTPSILADKTTNEGTMRIERISDSRVRRVADIVLECRVFGLGGMLEKTFEKAIRDGWGKSADHMSRKK
jgi:hypothetical protein